MKKLSKIHRLTNYTAFVLTLVSGVGNADSVYDWGYWAAPSSAGASSEQVGQYQYPEKVVTSVNANQTSYNGYDNITDEQVRIAINGGELLESSTKPVSGGWAGYILYDTTTSFNGNISNGVALLGLSPNANNGRLEITSDLEALNMSFDVKDTSNVNSIKPRFLEFGTEEGEFQASFGVDFPDSYKDVKAAGVSINGENNGEYFSQIEVAKFSTVGNFDTFSLNGLGVIAKVMPLADIAREAASLRTYNFSGISFNGSNVFLAVNFGPGTWSGTFGQALNRNFGYQATGNITGANLISTNVIGDASKIGINGYVQGGVITGTLGGVLNKADISPAVVIGKAELNVLQDAKTTKVNDVFAAKIVADVIK